MGFLNQFASYFTPQERDTELYAIWSAIGVNMEKAFLEEQNKLNAELSDINNFSEDTMRSWLAFFLQKIPYRTTATSQVTISLASENAKITTIPKYDKLISTNGVTYTLWEGLSLIPGDVRTVTAVQGNRIVETGTYSSLIKVQANNPDLTYINVKIGDTEIPPVSYETSYDQLKYIGPWKPQSETKDWGGTPNLQNAFGQKGEMYNVIADGKTKFSTEGIEQDFRAGDMIVYDGTTWGLLNKANELSPIQFTNSYVVPRNGYFAYYYNNYLYIKIFLGSEVDNPEGQKYEVSYIQSDGIQGKVEANTLSLVSSYVDIDENPVTFEISNTASSPAVNEPSVGKLGLYLKQRLYSSINISSVPEYTNWFNAQPEVGDCLVLSDYEKWVRAGKDETDQQVTGLVDVYLVGIDGEPLQAEVINELLERIEPYKDIAVLSVKQFTPVEQYLEFEYTSATNESAFEQFVQSVATQYYDLSYLQSKNASIFDNLDLTAVIKDILETSPYDSTGLILRGYHYKKSEEISASTPVIAITSYAGEKPGSGWYVLERYDSNNQRLEDLVFEEVENAGDTNSCQIYDPERSATSLGYHNNTIVSINLSTYLQDFTRGFLHCYWGMKNEGILTIGTDNGLRRLHDVTTKRAQ